MKKIEVVAAIIRKEDKLLATQREYGEWLAAGKREQSQTRLSSAEWEQARPKVMNEITTQKANEELASTTQKEDLAIQKSETTTQKPLNTTQKRIWEHLKNYPKATRRDMAASLGDITEDGVKFNIGLLQQYGALKRKGGRKNGEWEVNPDYLSE